MSTKAEVEIHFIGRVPEMFCSDTNIVKHLKEFHDEEKNGDCGIEVYEVKDFRNAVTFDLYSERHVNLIWQKDLLKKYLLEKFPKNITEFQANVWVSSDDEDINLTDGEWEDALLENQQ